MLIFSEKDVQRIESEMWYENLMKTGAYIEKQKKREYYRNKYHTDPVFKAAMDAKRRARPRFTS